MPFMAKQGNNYEEVETLVDTEGREIDYVLSKVGNTYKRTFTKVRELEDAPPLEFKSIKPQANLLDYRIYGQTSRNLLNFPHWANNVYVVRGTKIINGNSIAITSTADTCFTGWNTTEYPLDSKIPVAKGDHITFTWDTDANDASSVWIFPNATSDASVHTASANKKLEYTVPAGVSFITFRLDVSTANKTITYSNLMITKEDAITYEPYGESVGDRTGNLFDGDLQQGTLDGGGWEAQNANRVRTSFMDYPLSAGTYTFSAMGVDMVIVYFYSQPDTSTFVYRTSAVWSNLPYTFTTDGNYYSRFVFNTQSGTVPISPDDVSDAMLNAGSTALPYEPYGYKMPVTVSNGTDSEIVPIYLPEQIKKVGDYSDYIDYGSQKFVHRVVRKVFDGTENIQYYGHFGITNHSHFYFDFGTVNPIYLTTTPVAPWCNKYTPYPGWDAQNIADKCIRFQLYTETLRINYNRIYFTDDSVSSAEDFTAQLAEWYANGDPLIVDYIIETPVEEQVTLPALPTLTGTNVLSVGTEVQPSEMYIKGNIKGGGAA